MVKPQPLFLNWERDATEGMVTLVLRWPGFSLESRELRKQMFQFINHSFCLIISICCIHWQNPISSWMVRGHGMVVLKVQSPGTPVQVECASGREQTEYPAQRPLQINSDLICHLLWSYPSVSISVFLVTQLCLTFVTPWTVAYQARLSMGFSRQEYWGGLPCPPPGDLPNPGIEPRSQLFSI